jgi:nicotinamidase-related amidase
MGMSLAEIDRSLVVVIDFQGKLTGMVEGAAEVLAATARLLDMCDIFGVPAILTEQYPEGLGPTEESVRAAFDRLGSEKRQVTKTSFGCCGDDGFRSAVEELLPDRAPGERQYVIAGIEAHICVVQTVLELLAEGSEVFLCVECVSSRGAGFRAAALGRMAAAGAVLTNHESIGFEWARSKDHPGFKRLNRLLRDGQIGGG